MSLVQARAAEQTHVPCCLRTWPVPFSHAPAPECTQFLSQFNQRQGADLDREVEFGLFICIYRIYDLLVITPKGHASATGRAG